METGFWVQFAVFVWLGAMTLAIYVSIPQWVAGRENPKRHSVKILAWLSVIPFCFPLWFAAVVIAALYRPSKDDRSIAAEQLRIEKTKVVATSLVTPMAGSDVLSTAPQAESVADLDDEIKEERHKYRVTGIDGKTGKPVSFKVRAPGKADAERYAAKEGVVDAKIEHLGQG